MDYRRTSILLVVVLLAACRPNPAPVTTASPAPVASATATPESYPAPAGTGVSAATPAAPTLPASPVALATESAVPVNSAEPTRVPGTPIPPGELTGLTAVPTLQSPPIEVTAPATYTLVPGQGPQVSAFGADVLYAAPGQALTLAWQSSGAQQAALYTLGGNGQLGAALAWTPNGAISYTVPPGAVEAQRFALFVTGGGYTTVATTVLRVPCPAVWFFASGAGECPVAGATNSLGAEQHFEHGVMLWSQVTGRVYVLFNGDDGYNSGPAWTAFVDDWREGQPEIDPALQVPPGLQQPRRGFGNVWRNQPGVRERLGWAVDPEIGFDMAMQVTARPGHNWLYVKALHDGVWALGPEGGPWRYLPY